MKKYAALTSLIIFVLTVHACKFSLPTAAEIKTENLEVNVPTKVGSFDIASVLHKYIGEEFEKKGIELYDMPNYVDTNKNKPQTFLVSYSMDLLESFNPDDYLSKIREQMDKMDNLGPGMVDPIQTSITVPGIDWDSVPEEEYIFGMGNFFQAMEDVLNDTSIAGASQHIEFPVLIPTEDIDITQLLGDLTSFMVCNLDSGEENFTSVTVDKGSIKLNLKLDNIIADSEVRDNLVFTINGIKLVGASSGEDIGKSADNSPYPVTATLENASNFSTVVEIKLDGETIIVDDPPKFSIGGITAAYSGPTGKSASFDFVVEPEISGISLKGAEGLKIGVMEQNLPEDIVQSLEMDAMTGMDGFLNAEIQTGSLKINAAMPTKENTLNGTYCEGIVMEYKIVARQDTVSFDGADFDGVGKEPWLITVKEGEGTLDLANQKINGNALTIDNDNSMVTIRSVPEGISFMLEGDDLTNKELPVTISMDVNIDGLKTVRWKLSDENGGGELIPIPDDIEIDFANIGESSSGAGDGTNIADFIESIKFDGINLDMDFNIPTENTPAGLTPGGLGLPEAVKNSMAIKIKCEELGFDGTPKMLDEETGKIEFSSTLETLILKDPITQEAKKLKIEVGVVPVINNVPNPDAKYLELGPITFADSGETKLDLYAQVNFSPDWIEANINLNKALEAADADTDMLSGIYPGADEDPIDLSVAGDYANGFTLNGIEARMFLSGPRGLIEKINPGLKFTAVWNDPIDGDATNGAPENWADKEELFSGTLTISDVGDLPVLPGKNENDKYIYPDPDLSKLGEGMTIGSGITDVVAAFPKNLRFSYKMELPETFTVQKSMFDDITDGDSKIKAQVMLMLPLSLTGKAAAEGEPGAYISVPNDIFGEDSDNTDLFSFIRKSLDEDSTLSKINIKSVGIKIDFDSDMLSGGILHLDANKNLFPNGLSMGTGKSFNITLNEKDWKIIKENKIPPEIKIEFPKGTNLIVGRNPLPTKITITASGSFTLDFASLNTGN